MPVNKILIIEDESTSRKILSLALDGEGRELIFAEDGERGVELAKTHRPDLIIMDIMLPKMNGYEATRLIKKDGDLKDIPIIALTARTMTFDRKQAVEAGCVDFITKPFRVIELRNQVLKHLEGG